MRKQLNCPNCGAPITGDRCEYCGTQFIDCTTVKSGEPFYLKIQLGDTVNVIKVFLNELSIGVEQDYADMARTIDGYMTKVVCSQHYIINAQYVSAN